MATMREQLQAEAESRALHQGMPIEQTPKDRDLRAIANLADDQVRIKHQAVAPHPRCTLWFGERGEHGMPSSKQTCGCSCSPARPSRKSRPCATSIVARAEVWAKRNLYLPTGGQRPQDSARPALKTPSTYRLGGIAYVAQDKPSARKEG